VPRHYVARACLSAPRRHAASLFSLPPTPHRWWPGPVATRPHLSAAPHHVKHAPPPSPVHQPASTASARTTSDRAAGSHPDPMVRAADHRVRGSLSLSHFPSSTQHRADPPPIFLSCSPHAPADMEKSSVPHSALFHIHTWARAPLLLHRLRACLDGSRHQRPLLLSGSRPSTTAFRHYRWAWPHVRSLSPSKWTHPSPSPSRATPSPLARSHWPHHRATPERSRVRWPRRACTPHRA
jgi:hypothetical protein